MELMDQLDKISQANHDIGRSEAVRDAMTLVSAHIDTVENKIMARWDELKQLREQGQSIYAEDDKVMHGLNDQRRVLHAIHKELVSL
jgi:metal-responsive CopG/Arc/MetJ family transcriptional regulator